MKSTLPSSVTDSLQSLSSLLSLPFGGQEDRDWNRWKDEKKNRRDVRLLESISLADDGKYVVNVNKLLGMTLGEFTSGGEDRRCKMCRTFTNHWYHSCVHYRPRGATSSSKRQDVFCGFKGCYFCDPVTHELVEKWRKSPSGVNTLYHLTAAESADMKRSLCDMGIYHPELKESSSSLSVSGTQRRVVASPSAKCSTPATANEVIDLTGSRSEVETSKRKEGSTPRAPKKRPRQQGGVMDLTEGEVIDLTNEE